MTIPICVSDVLAPALKPDALHFPVGRASNMCDAFVCIVHTCDTGIVHHDNLFEQDGGRRVQDAVDRPEQGGPSLVVEDDNDAGGWQSRTAGEPPFHTPDFFKKCNLRTWKWQLEVNLKDPLLSWPRVIPEATAE